MFGSDPSSNHSNPGPSDSKAGPPGATSSAGHGPSSFAGLGKLIAEAAGGHTGQAGAGAAAAAAAATDSSDGPTRQGSAATAPCGTGAGAGSSGSGGSKQDGVSGRSVLLNVLHGKQRASAPGMQANLAKLPNFRAPDVGRRA